MKAWLNGVPVRLRGLKPVIGVYLVAGGTAGGNTVGAGGVTTRVVSIAVLPTPQAPVDGLRVRVNGEEVEIAVMVPVPVLVGPTAVRVVDQVPRTLLRVRVNGEVVEIAVMVPWVLYWPSISMTPLISMPTRLHEPPA